MDAMSRYPRIRAIVPRLLRGSMESKLEELVREGGKNPERPKQMAAVKYYLQDIITGCQDKWLTKSRGITNYRGFLDEVEGWRQNANLNEVFLVTFNYDTMLEDALAEDLRIRGPYPERPLIRKIDDYLRWSYKVIKPHGSINWMHSVTTQGAFLNARNPFELIEIMINSVDELRIDRKIDVVDSYLKKHGKARIPAIAIPVEAKSEYECPEEHLQELWKYLPEVKLMMTIGWRANEKTFVGRLIHGLTRQVKTLIVSSTPDSADESAKHLREEGLKGDILPSKTYGFSEFVANAEATRFLNQMAATPG